MGHEKQQQLSATGTWDFDTNPGEHESGQPSSSASSHDRRDKQMLYIQVPARFSLSISCMLALSKRKGWRCISHC